MKTFGFVSLVRSVLPLLLAVWLFTCHAGAVEPFAQVHAANSILTAWQNDFPEIGNRRLHIIAWRVRDRDFPVQQHERLDRMLTSIQQFYRREMQRHGFGPQSICLDRSETGKLVIHEVIGEGRWEDYAVGDGNRIRKECLPVLRAKGIDIDKETIMIFTNLSEWNSEKRIFRHKSPYYAGGDWRRGTAWQLDSPELDVMNLSRTAPLIYDAQYGRISLGKHNSIFIGGIAHELGHALGLPHCKARPDEQIHGTALMGSGNRTYGDEIRNEGRGSFLTLAHALRLTSHPQFSGSVKAFSSEPTCSFSSLVAKPIENHKGFSVSGRVIGRPPIYAVIGYLDPDGGSDYDAHTISAVPSKDGRFTLECTALVPHKKAQLRIVACHANGATASLQQPYVVESDGRVNIETMQVLFELQAFFDELSAQGPTHAAQFAPDQGPAALYAKAILDGRQRRGAVVPGAVNAGVDRVSLSQCQATDAKVGWLQPAYDYLPRREAVIESAGKLYQSGIYAHAPSRYAYSLKKKWKRLHGACGLPTQRGGSVAFRIEADGMEIFRSRVLIPGKTQAFDIDVSDVQDIVLITEDGGDGKASDWGVWLAPELMR